MSGNRVKVGIVGLGRWAKVLTRAAAHSDALEIVAGFSRSEEKRAAFRAANSACRARPISRRCSADPEIKGVILTVPNEQHLPLAREVAKAGKHVYTEKPIASTLEDGLAIEALEKTYGVTRDGRPQRAADGRHPRHRARRSRRASSAASPSWRRISPTSARSS